MSDDVTAVEEDDGWETHSTADVVQELILEIGHLFGHLIDEHKGVSPHHGGRRTFVIGDQTVSIHYDSSSINLTSTCGPSTLVVTVGSWQYLEEMFEIVE